MKVRDILKDKGTNVVTVQPRESIRTLLDKMKHEGIGAVVASDDGKRVDGIVSERDIVHGLAAHGAALLDMPVADVMTKEVVTCKYEESVKDVMQMMTQGRMRHLPVVEGGKLVGIVSIGDVVKNRLEDAEMEARQLRDYITTQ